MAVTTSVCLNCKINSDANAGMRFHEIFDEVGLELQLPFLVKTFFYIDLSKKDKQHLCDDCVNRLIELYDLDELAKEESCKTNNLKNMQECSYNEESSKHLQNESGNFRYERENAHKPLLIDQNNTQANITKSSSLENKTFALTQGENSIKIKKRNKSEDKDSTEYESKVLQDFSLSSSAIKDEKSNELGSNENMEFISDDENQNVKINKQSNANIIDDSKKFQIKEPEASQNFDISFSLNAIKDELESNEHMEFISDEENVEINKQSNTNIIVNVREEVDETEQAYTPKKTHNENDGQKDLCVEEVDDRLNQILNNSESNSNDSNSLLEELNITEEKEAFLLNASSSAIQFNKKEHIDADDFIVKEDISDDTCSVEEDNLIEKIILSEEYDQVDLNEYLDKVLITKFQDLVLNWEMECKLCLEKYYSFGELLKHACMVEFEKEQQLSCIIKDCEDDAKDLPTLARHLILTHYDKLESIDIYSKCTDCQKTFSNVLDLNKHSCCQNIKRKADVLNCKYCDLNFPSLKRYGFHMQFHLKNHRPKICLLCGDIFKKSNDFFEHTQYTHNPASALTCERCDRYFKDKKVFNTHMKLHKDSRYKCTLCPKMYYQKFRLKRHMDIYHNKKSKEFQCEYCRKIYGYKYSYLAHIKSHATDAKVKTFLCSICGLLSNKMEMIKEHIESDSESSCFSSSIDEKILAFGYSCENCSLDFCTIKHLKAHRLSDSHSDDLFYCGICRKSFNTLIHMRNHSNAHKDLKEWQESFPITRRFVCNIGDCQEFFSKWSALHFHKKRPHKEKTKEKPNLKCHICQQLYLNQRTLAVHIAKAHNTEKPKCSHCKRNFVSQKSLQKHIDRQHTPAECDICLKIYKSQINLETHITIVHNSKMRYFCKHCQKGYVYKHQLNIHEKNVCKSKK